MPSGVRLPMEVLTSLWIKIVMRRRISLIAVCATVLLLARPVAALELMETFEATQDPGRILAGILHLGEDETWVGEFEDGAYVLSNAKTPGAVRYFHLGAADGSRATRVSVDVSGRSGGEVSGNGLIYCYGDDGRTYFAFIAEDDGELLLLKKGPGALKLLARKSSPAAMPGQANRLTVELEVGSAKLFVNGVKLLEHGNKDLPPGAEVGLIALGKGSHRFDNFELITE